MILRGALLLAIEPVGLRGADTGQPVCTGANTIDFLELPVQVALVGKAQLRRHLEWQTALLQQSSGMGDTLLHQPGVRWHAGGALKYAGKVEWRQIDCGGEFYQ